MDIVELTGVVKWFDITKGIGFIIPDNGMPDVLLHITCLRRDGYYTAFEGARVECEVLRHPKGLRVFRILSMDESAASDIPTRAASAHTGIIPVGGFEPARCKWFNRLRGFGFLILEGKPDVFVHMETLRRCGLGALRMDEKVLVRFGPGPKGSMATAVRHCDGQGREVR